MRIHYLQHDELVTICTIQDWANEHNYQLTCTHTAAQENYPDLNDFDLLIILGGRMGAYEEELHPWLTKEKQFIKEAIDQNKLVLGICLGAQILADVLGGKAYPHTVKEVGWWPVTFTEATIGTLLQGFEGEHTLFQFHQDTFTLPPEAVVVASSAACQNQAFLYKDHVLGVQFHPEIEVENIRTLSAVVGESQGPYIQPATQFIAAAEHFARTKEMMYMILNNFVAKNIVATH